MLVTNSATGVPEFGVGQVDGGVDEYAHEAIERVCERNGIEEPEKGRLLNAFFAALEVCKVELPKTLTSPMTTTLPEGRELWNVCGEIFVGSGSELHGKENLTQAFDAMAQGDNVLLVSNHTSGADTMFMETLASREYGRDVFANAAYMSGHAVNLYLFPYLMTSGLTRFQIFSRKYKSMAVTGSGVVQDTGAGEAAMNAQNVRSLRALGRYTKAGGRMIGLYPEGGRGEGGLKSGEPNTMCIPEIIAKSGKPLHVLPVHVEGAPSILPVNRTENEYNEFFEHISIGEGILRVGSMVPWASIQELSEVTDGIRSRVLSHLSFEDGDEKTLSRNMKIALVMSLIANLSPRDDEKGAHNNADAREAVAHLLGST